MVAVLVACSCHDLIVEIDEPWLSIAICHLDVESLTVLLGPE